jgi:hypothetical protein
MPYMVPYIDQTMTNKHLTPRELYAKLDAYYDANGLYDAPSLNAHQLSKFMEAMKPLRNVANRSVEFYANKIIPGNVEIVTTNDRLKEAIEQVLKWSNFDGQRQKWMRGLSKYGDLYLKINVANDKVYLEQIEAKYVKDFEENDRGILQWIRIEIPQLDESGNNVYYVEYWDKGYFSTWIAPQEDMELDQLGDAQDYGLIKGLGIDFVPFIHVKFKDVGKERGAGCFTHALDKIDEANRQATNLAQLIFKAEGIWVQRSDSLDKDGRPVAPAPVTNSAGTQTNNLELTKNAFVRLPAGTDLVPTIPDINYASIRDIANDMVTELTQDLPELKYYSLEGGDLSGKAISLLLAGALDRAQEAGRNFKAGLIRAAQIALTMGITGGVVDASLGTYDAGDFEHDYSFGLYFTPDATDKSTNLQTLVTATVPLEVAMKIAGYSKDEIDETIKAKKTQTQPPNGAGNGIAPQQNGQGAVEITQNDITSAIAKAKERGLSRAAALMSR